MAVRHFTRTSRTEIGLLVGAIPKLGPMTCAALINKSTDVGAYEFILNGGGTDPNDWIFYIDDTNHITFWTGTANIASTMTVLASEGWVLLAGTKESGTVGCIFHKCVLTTGVWTHEAITAATSANSGTPSYAKFGGDGAGADTNHFNGHIVAAGVWASVLNSTQLEAIAPGHYADMNALITGWNATTPAGLWRLDQAATSTHVDDQTAGGANQNSIVGTSVVTGEDPVFGVLPPVAGAGRRFDMTAAMMLVMDG